MTSTEKLWAVCNENGRIVLKFYSKITAVAACGWNMHVRKFDTDKRRWVKT